jgi:hypothetical protein
MVHGPPVGNGGGTQDDLVGKDHVRHVKDEVVDDKESDKGVDNH